MTYYLTCKECDYYSFDMKKIEEIKTMEYPEIDYKKNGFYHFEIGVVKHHKYNAIGNATVLIHNCRCVKADIRLTLV